MPTGDNCASWYGQTGALAAINGEAEGWVAIQRAFKYRALAERILIANLDTGKARFASLYYVTYPLVHAIVAKDDAYADWLGNRLITSNNTSDKKVIAWDMAPFYPFAVKLFANWRGVPLDFTAKNVSPLGIYQELLDAWHDEEGFATVLRACCDYHVAHAFFDPKGYVEFCNPLYTVFPFEILAIQRVRREQGLPTPKIDHPLMLTPLAHPPEVMPKVEDELLDQVIAKVRKELPIGDPW